MHQDFGPQHKRSSRDIVVDRKLRKMMGIQTHGSERFSTDIKSMHFSKMQQNCLQRKGIRLAYSSNQQSSNIIKVDQLRHKPDIYIQQFYNNNTNQVVNNNSVRYQKRFNIRSNQENHSYSDKIAPQSPKKSQTVLLSAPNQNTSSINNTQSGRVIVFNGSNLSQIPVSLVNNGKTIKSVNDPCSKIKVIQRPPSNKLHLTKFNVKPHHLGCNKVQVVPTHLSNSSSISNSVSRTINTNNSYQSQNMVNFESNSPSNTLSSQQEMFDDNQIYFNNSLVSVEDTFQSNTMSSPQQLAYENSQSVQIPLTNIQGQIENAHSIEDNKVSMNTPQPLTFENVNKFQFENSQQLPMDLPYLSPPSTSRDSSFMSACSSPSQSEESLPQDLDEIFDSVADNVDFFNMSQEDLLELGHQARQDMKQGGLNSDEIFGDILPYINKDQNTIMQSPQNSNISDSPNSQQLVYSELDKGGVNGSLPPTPPRSPNDRNEIDNILLNYPEIHYRYANFPWENIHEYLECTNLPEFITRFMTVVDQKPKPLEIVDSHGLEKTGTVYYYSGTQDYDMGNSALLDDAFGVGPYTKSLDVMTARDPMWGMWGKGDCCKNPEPRKRSLSECAEGYNDLLFLGNDGFPPTPNANENDHDYDDEIQEPEYKRQRTSSASSSFSAASNEEQGGNIDHNYSNTKYLTNGQPMDQQQLSPSASVSHLHSVSNESGKFADLNYFSFFLYYLS